jgi:KipI family sensor histidine kinase inhibitor
VPVEVVAFGDRAWLVTTEDQSSAHRLAAAVERSIAEDGAPPGASEAVVGMSNVVVHVDPPSVGSATLGATTDAPAGAWPTWLSELHASSAATPGNRSASSWSPVDVPTVFDGPDLDEVAALAGTDLGGVVDLLCRADLQVAFLGFSPGFPYLVGLPDDLARIPRRATPRTEVPAGSVALAGGFAGIYPQATPGGWWLVGRTSLRLFDPTSPPFARLRAGDRVHLAEAPRPRARPAKSASAAPRAPITTRSSRAVDVVDPGLFTTVQDAGRAAVAGLGVPKAGPCDPDAMRLANRLAGNDDGAATLEITAAGPTLRCHADTHVAVVGAGPGAIAMTVDGRPAIDSAPVPLAAGQTLALGQVVVGLRAYLAVGGGFTIPAVVGSRSSDVLCGLGPGRLLAGDRLPVGPPGRPRGSLVPGGRADRAGVRVMAGPHPFPHDALEALVATTWTVSPSSSRIGLRLESASRRLPPGPPIRSTGMVTGAVQVPPDGRPIVLMPDHATVGGYPVVATVIGADLAVLGQLSPGDTVRFHLVDHKAANAAARRVEEALAARVKGWYPTRPAT